MVSDPGTRPNYKYQKKKLNLLWKQINKWTDTWKHFAIDCRQIWAIKHVNRFTKGFSKPKTGWGCIISYMYIYIYRIYPDVVMVHRVIFFYTVRCIALRYYNKINWNNLQNNLQKNRQTTNKQKNEKNNKRKKEWMNNELKNNGTNEISNNRLNERATNEKSN
jgi:hypothetical protein